MSDKKELANEDLKKVSGGLAIDKIQILDQKVQDYYKQGYITMDVMIEVHNALWTGDDYTIHKCLYPKVDGPNGFWTKLYLEFSSYKN